MHEPRWSLEQLGAAKRWDESMVGLLLSQEFPGEILGQRGYYVLDSNLKMQFISNVFICAMYYR